MWVKISEHYEASTEGHIRRRETKRVLKEFIGKDGYARTQFDGKLRLVHRVIAFAFLPTMEGRDQVNHKDGCKRNNAVSNLEWCTQSENIQHGYDHGLFPKPTGSKNGRSLLTESDVGYIKNHYIAFHKTYGATALAKQFGVARQTVTAIVTGQNWKLGGTTK